MAQNRDNINLEIILVLLKGKTYLRDIARILKVHHSTIARKLNYLTKENVLDFKQEGKNKVFFIKKNIQARNYVYNAERYKLIKLLKKYPELSIITEEILNVAEEKLIILFGSYSKFIAKETSDIDIYMETNSKKVKEKIESINSKIKVKIGKFDSSDLLIKEIVKDHVLLKGVEDFYEKTKFFE